MHIYTDSESMITKLKKMNEYPTAKHRMTLHPEWDVLYALHHTLESFPKRPTIEWVESHQDDHKANRNLSFGAKLNIQADKLATIGLQSLKCKPRVPMAPSSCVQIHMNGTTITREFRKEVRLRVHKQKLSEYYCARFRWSSRLITRIDWSIFGPAYIRRTKKKFVWTHKFHNRKLPTGERMKNRGGLEDERCCSCGALLETDDHLFQCPKRPQFHRRLLTVVGEMQTILDPTLYYILYDGIYNFITDSNEEKLNLPPTQKKRSPCISSDSETVDDESDDRSVAAKKEKPPSRRKRKRQATDTEKTRDLYLLKREKRIQDGTIYFEENSPKDGGHCNGDTNYERNTNEMNEGYASNVIVVNTPLTHMMLTVTGMKRRKRMHFKALLKKYSTYAKTKCGSKGTLTDTSLIMGATTQQ